MPRVYLDQDALIALGRRRPYEQLRRRIEGREITLVLSPAHLMDTAGGPSAENSRAMARFIDSLRPIWLKELVKLQRLEIQGHLQRLSFEQVRERATCNTISEIVADLDGLEEGGALIVNTEGMVRTLRDNKRIREIFEHVYTGRAQAYRQNRRRFRGGRVPAALDQQLRVAYIRRIGNIVPDSVEDQRLRAARPDSLRSITCGFEASQESWRQGGVMTPNRIRDLFHLAVAMPYTDVILTMDGQMRGTISSVKRRVQFPVAQEVGSPAQLIRVLEGNSA